MFRALWTLYRAARRSPNLFVFACGFFLAVFGPAIVIETIPRSLSSIPPIRPYVEHLLRDTPWQVDVAVSIELAAATIMLIGLTRVLRPRE